MIDKPIEEDLRKAEEICKRHLKNVLKVIKNVFVCGSLRLPMERLDDGTLLDEIVKALSEARREQRLNWQDLECMLSAIRGLEEEGCNDAFLNPKKNLAGKIAKMLTDEEFESIRTPKWLKVIRREGVGG